MAKGKYFFRSRLHYLILYFCFKKGRTNCSLYNVQMSFLKLLNNFFDRTREEE